MYNAFFGLKESPFNLSPDPSFLYRSAQHEETVCLGGAFLGALVLCRELHVQQGGFVCLVPGDDYRTGDAIGAELPPSRRSLDAP